MMHLDGILLPPNTEDILSIAMSRPVVLGSTTSKGPDQFALIIGAMKSGTTSLFELLAQHPEIAAARVKEPDFFTSPDSASRWNDYLSLWDWDPTVHRIALEASTAYTKYPWIGGVPERIASSPGRSFKFIYVMRDPIKRIASQVRHSLYEGWGRSLDAGMTPDLIDFSRYATQVDRFLEHFPRTDMLLLTLEELQQRPEEVLLRTCRFLGVSEYAFAGYEEPRNTGDFYSVHPLISTLARTRVARWAIDHLLSNQMHHLLRRSVAKLSAGAPRKLERWQLNEAEVARVRQELAEEMQRLKLEYGIEASWTTRGS